MPTYTKYDPSKLILRDALAVERTVMANERTVLGYLRTGIAFGISGASLLKLFDERILHITGWGLMAMSIPIFVFGLRRFTQVRKHLAPFDKAGD